MEEMNVMDWVSLVTKVGMQIALIVAPIVIAYMEKRKVEGATIARAVADSVAVVAREIEKGEVEKGEAAKGKALALAAKAAGKTKGFKGRSLSLAELALEGEVKRRKVAA
jgi:hypothetical protein